MTADTRPEDPGITGPATADPASDASVSAPSMATDSAAMPTDALAPEAAHATDALARAAEPVPAAVTDAPSKPRRRLALAAGVLRMLTLLLTFSLFAVGVVLGVTMFQRMQPAPAAVAVAPIVNAPAPAVVQEFVTALGSNDPDALRSAVPAEPYAQLVGEMQRWKFQQVSKVETLSTFVDGDRSATELVLLGRDTAGVPVLINLVVQTQSGRITVFR